MAQLWRRRVLFVSVFLVTFTGVAAVMKVLPIRYSAAGTIIVAEQEPAAGAGSAAWVQKLGDPADLESQLLVIRSPRMMRLALSQPGVLAAIEQECQYAGRPSSFGPLAGLLGRGVVCDRLAASSEAALNWVETRYAVTSIGRSRVISVGYSVGACRTWPGLWPTR